MYVVVGSTYIYSYTKITVKKGQITCYPIPGQKASELGGNHQSENTALLTYNSFVVQSSN